MRLDPDEELLLDLRRHGNHLVLPVLVLLVVMAGLGYGLAVAPGALVAAVVAGALLLLALLSLLPFLRWRSRRLLLTTRRLVVRSGVLSRSGRDVPLARVQEVGFHRSWRQRLLGRGTLVVQVAGAGALEVGGLRHVEQVALWVEEELAGPERDD